ncbi:hypothetical protein SJ059_32560, partial [Klebsiella aerogenes]|nr:hypothetical protein [Klebsiella aerogenes]
MCIRDSYATLATFNIQIAGFHPIIPALLLSLVAFLVANRFGEQTLPQSAPLQ